MKRKLSIEEEAEVKPKKTKQTTVTAFLIEPTIKKGEIKVARYFATTKTMRKIPNYTNVLIHTRAGGLGGDLSPYVLKNKKGQLIENVWQFSKWYADVSAQKIPVSRFHQNKIIWEHPAEKHLECDQPTKSYWAWREKGMNNPFPVRYPNGIKSRHKVICSFLVNEENKKVESLGYIDARKRIYCAEYFHNAPETECFQKLQRMLGEGINICIWEVDGPNFTSTYGPFTAICAQHPGLNITAKTIRLLVNDGKQPFGHGYVIAALLLGYEKEMFE